VVSKRIDLAPHPALWDEAATGSAQLMSFAQGGGFMGPEGRDMQVILGRLNRLEKQNRRLQRAGVLGLLGAGIVLLSGQVAPSNRIIEAQKFVLTDAEGKSRGEWSANAAITQIALFDQEGTRSVSLMADARGNESTLSLTNRHGKRLLVSAFLDSGVVSLSQKADSADWQYHFELADRGGPDYVTALRLWNAKGSAHAALEASSAGASLQVDSEASKTVMGSTVLDTSSAGGTHHTSAASLTMVDRTGKIIWRAP
jgi:hypothetical protein